MHSNQHAVPLHHHATNPFVGLLDHSATGLPEAYVRIDPQYAGPFGIALPRGAPEHPDTCGSAQYLHNAPPLLGSSHHGGAGSGPRLNPAAESATRTLAPPLALVPTRRRRRPGRSVDAEYWPDRASGMARCLPRCVPAIVPARYREPTARAGGARGNGGRSGNPPSVYNSSTTRSAVVWLNRSTTGKC